MPWETVEDDVDRLAVPGGWLYYTKGNSTVFVPYPPNTLEITTNAFKRGYDEAKGDKVKPFDVADTAAALHGALRFLDHGNEQFARELIESVIKTLEGE